jgi:hypothetical protein
MPQGIDEQLGDRAMDPIRYAADSKPISKILEQARQNPSPIDLVKRSCPCDRKAILFGVLFDPPQAP